MHNAPTKTCSQRHTQQIFVAFRTANFFEQSIYIRQETGNGFSIGEEVAVIVNKDRNAKFLFKHRSQRYTAPKTRKIAEVPDDAVGIICRAGKGKADGSGRPRA